MSRERREQAFIGGAAVALMGVLIAEGIAFWLMLPHLCAMFVYGFGAGIVFAATIIDPTPIQPARTPETPA